MMRPTNNVEDAMRINDSRPGEVLVKLNPARGSLTDVLENLPVQEIERLDAVAPGVSNQDPGLYRLELGQGWTTEQAMAELKDDPRVEYAVPNHVYELDRKPNDLDQGFFGTPLWGLEKIQAPAAWNTTVGARNGPIVAVLDTGADIRHPDLAANLWTNTGEIPGNGIDDDGNGVVDDVHGYNATANNGDLTDYHKHGTHTAGTIGAVGNNGQGVVGVNWEARIMPIRIFDEEGRTDVASIVKGLKYADRMGARITSNSWGGTLENRALEEAFQNSPALHIAAAGNSGIDNDRIPHYPSSYPMDNMVSVAATDKRDRLTNFSNYGATSVDLAAPGAGIKSTVPGGGYASMNGTSMACPHVTGVAALVATRHPELSNAQLKARLMESADPVPGLAGKVASGGRLNAARALESQAAPAAGLQLEVDVTRPLTPGQPALLELGVKDAAGMLVTDFDVEHEKPMHLIVVSEDLSTFAHLHPAMGEDGRFRVNLNTASMDPDNADAAKAIQLAGAHLAFAEVRPRGQEVQRLDFKLQAEGDVKPHPLVPDVTGNGQVTRYFSGDGQPGKEGAPYRVSFELGDMREHGMLHLSYNLERRNGDRYEPIDDAQNWLGMPGHAVMIGRDVFHHLHAGHHGHHLEAAGPEFTFMLHEDLPPDGVYKVWGQFKTGDRVVTFPFTFELS